MNVKSIYNKQSIIDAVSTDESKFGQYAIKISSPSLGNITGILKEAINFSVDASWATLGLEGVIDSIMSSNGLLNAVDTYFDITNLASGSSFSNTGIFSKLFYKNSGRLSISPSFRIFDFAGNGICTQAVTTLTALCIPKVKEGDQISLQKIGDAGVRGLNKGQDIAKNIPIGDGASSVNDLPLVAGSFDRGRIGAKKIGESTANWSNAPDPVKIQIGKWLIIDQAVVENVSFNFSYECTEAGPMWVDIGMKLSSIENIYIDPDGSLAQVKVGDTDKGRVTIKNNTSASNSDFNTFF